MRLLPSDQTAAQLKTLRQFLETGMIRLQEPCDCGGQIRHNNGGNYHETFHAKADAGGWFIRHESSSDYDDSEWEPASFTECLEKIQERAGWGWYF